MKYKKMKSATLLFFLFLMEASTYSVANSEAKIKLNRKVSESSYGSDEQVKIKLIKIQNRAKVQCSCGKI